VYDHLPGSARAPVLFLMRLLFVAACLVVGYGVFMPPGGGPSLMPWDKAEHFTAFFGLMFLAMAAFPMSPLLKLGIILSAAGAAVEMIQATPIVHRDADMMDWVADTLGILAVVGPLLMQQLRRDLAVKGL
jgi:hypothetical protein